MTAALIAFVLIPATGAVALAVLGWLEDQSPRCPACGRKSLTRKRMARHFAKAHPDELRQIIKSVKRIAAALKEHR